MVGNTNTFAVHAYDNSSLITNARYSALNTWSQSYKLYFDPIFFRVIFDLDISKD